MPRHILLAPIVFEIYSVEKIETVGSDGWGSGFGSATSNLWDTE